MVYGVRGTKINIEHDDQFIGTSILVVTTTCNR